MTASKFSIGGMIIVTLFGLSVQTLQANLNYQDFSSTQGLNLVGNAIQSGTIVKITPSAPSNVGGTWATNKQAVNMGFTTTFRFNITDQHAWDQKGSDGFAFVIQNSNGSALGNDGQYIGYNIPNSVAVEFDTYNNSIYFSDGAYPHVSVQTRGQSTNSPNHTYSHGYTSAIPDIQDGNTHTIQINYNPGVMNVYMDTNFILSVPLDLTTLNLDGGKAWVGFTGSTGMGYEAHNLLSWSYTEVPEPGMISLILLGGLISLTKKRVRR
jgi:hypothetical protein